MTTTARIAATVNPSVAYEFSVAVGVTANFACIGLKIGEEVAIEVKDSSGGFAPFDYIDAGGNSRRAAMVKGFNVIPITGPVDARLNKSATSVAIEVVEYT